MKILVLAHHDVMMFKCRCELLQALLKEHEVYVSAPNGSVAAALKNMGCHFVDTPVDRRGINPFRDATLLLNYYKIIKEIKPDLVITYAIKPNIYGGLICRMFNVPYAPNVTGLGTAFQKDGFLKTLVRAMYIIALKRAKVVFFENVGNMHTFQKETGMPIEKCHVLNGAGVNLNQFAYVHYPEDREETRFLFLGRVMKEKGVEELFAAMQKLRAEGRECSLDILGWYEEDYAAQIKKHEADGWLHYHGFQDDVRPFMANAHCVVLPSWHEGMANTNLEGAAVGRPLITSNIHGCKEAVIEGESGFLCEAKDTDSLYEAMRTFCDLTTEQREAMGKVGRKHMEAVFDKQKVVAETIECLGL